MKTMGIQEASEFIRVHSVTLSTMAKAGKIPAAKPGKEWVFIDVDLVEWLRSQYRTQTYVSDSTEKERKQCHSTNVKIQKSGGTSSLMKVESEYRNQLGLK